MSIINTNTNGVTVSRLLTENNNFRNIIVSRNLYTPADEYSLSTYSNTDNSTQKTVNAINSIISTVSPFNAFNLSDTVIGRLVVDKTPLTQIGLSVLGKQLAYNSMSHLAQQTFPVISISNALNGGNLFTTKVNYSITTQPPINSFLTNFINTVTTLTINQNYPFNSTSSNADYITNSGTGQLAFLYKAINKNVYKEGFGQSNNDSVLFNNSKKANIPLTKRNTIISSVSSNYNKYYNFFKTNPYSNIRPSDTSINSANKDIINSLNAIVPGISPTQEYAPDINFVEKSFGSSVKEDIFNINSTSNDWVSTSDDPNSNLNNIVWGRDGSTPATDRGLDELRGSSTFVKNQLYNIPSNNIDLSKFDVHTGLLEYTKNLMNASEGTLVDTTRQAFLSGKNVEGFNGNALWVANKSTYAQKSGIAGQTGIRQHSSLDQYDRFTKAIRFNGNIVYGGNPNSVIYNSVLPRIHPTLNKDNTPNSKNLMFSIENLAVRVLSKDGVGIIDDEYGSTIPITEVGQFNGRLMWFPPYNIEVNESTSAKYEPTVMVGRSEPIYSYMYTERNATLTFTLLVDYPDNLKNYKGNDKHRIISEFFAFGGDAFAPLSPITNPDKKSVDKNNQIKQITGPTQQAEPDVISPSTVTMVFPNNFPNDDQVNTAIDTMFLDYEYEIKSNNVQSNGDISIGYNNNIFVVDTDFLLSDPVTKHTYLDKTLLPVGYSQYNLTGNTSLNTNLIAVYSNVNNRKYYDVVIVGGASLLYTEQPNAVVKKEPAYNKALGLRRANAAKVLVEQRIKTLFGNTPDNLGINVTLDTSTNGSTGSNLAAASTAQISDIESKNSKLARYADIKIIRNSKSPVLKVQPTSATDQANIASIQSDIAANDKISKKQDSNLVNENVYKERTTSNNNGQSGDGAILKGFKSVSDNYFYPVFHSQTPEDFHRRLTFLQQCMRQGAAKVFNTVDSNNLTVKNSVFGRQPICALRIGDFLFSKVIIENLTIDYVDAPWDTNPEGFGLQPMMAKVSLQMKIIGGQSLKGPVDALQNAVTFNHYANSTFTNAGMYFRPSKEADKQESFINGILTAETDNLMSNNNLNNFTTNQSGLIQPTPL
jgi:hypothetical protein